MRVKRCKLSDIYVSVSLIFSIIWSVSLQATTISGPAPGSYAVGSTNMEIAPEFAGLDYDTMHRHLIGQPDANGNPAFILELLKHPESAWVTEVQIPANKEMFAGASDLPLPVVSFITYPTKAKPHKNTYHFPYMDSAFGAFEDMLAPGEQPEFADPDALYPLIVLSHGYSAHGIYDIAHAHSLSQSGYIVVVLFYGDLRTAGPDFFSAHQDFLRPLHTKAVLDSLLASDTFGPHIDKDNIGISGHSFGGFTALALAGADPQDNTTSVKDPRINAAVIAAPWVGGIIDGKEIDAFGKGNLSLSNVTIPVITLFGTKDEATTAESILPAVKILSGTRYLVELVDQPHVFEDGSWQDRNNWELLFFNAYLKGDNEARQRLKIGASMAGGNVDKQWFDYQQIVE